MVFLNGCSSEIETLFIDGPSDSSGEEKSDTDKSILFPETDSVAAPEPPSKGEGGEKEEAKQVFRGQWGTLVSFRRSTMIEGKICLTFLRILEPGCFLSSMRIMSLGDRRGPPRIFKRFIMECKIGTIGLIRITLPLL